MDSFSSVQRQGTRALPYKVMRYRDWADRVVRPYAPPGNAMRSMQNPMSLRAGANTGYPATNPSAGLRGQTLRGFFDTLTACGRSPSFAEREAIFPLIIPFLHRPTLC